MATGFEARSVSAGAIEGPPPDWRTTVAPRAQLKRLSGLVAELNPQSLVDLGCRGGELLDEIARRISTSRLMGIDGSEQLLAANRRRRPGIVWHRADLSTPLAARGEPFEAATASEVLERVDDPELLLRNAGRFVRPGGYLFLSTQSGPIGPAEWRGGHRQHFTAAQLTAQLRATGWQPVKVWNEGFPFHDLSKWYSEVDPGPYPYTWKLGMRVLFQLNSKRSGPQLYAVARRAA